MAVKLIDYALSGTVSNPDGSLPIAFSGVTVVPGPGRRQQGSDREAALELMSDASSLVDAALRRRPVPSGPPFTLRGGTEVPGS